ncbi:Rid family hydrolase [Jiangella mangrovi]|uniref:2-iminobutanoate/2-iminopropanoate deaminase n=1 Tax=Jiangella mangrovi TaxID=1524084 RepID=A0A7W9LPQ8_9ACTN|nr:2-iminobutanoate/2-iminopropanoate deaminase [Jiangella mangrovi]
MTATSPDTAPFSAYVQAGPFVFVSGQASVDEAGRLVPGTFEEQMRRSIENVRRVLALAGLDLRHVVRTGCYVHDPADAPEFNRIYLEYFPPPRPARTTLTGCLTEQVRFEIDVVAFAGDGEG